MRRDRTQQCVDVFNAQLPALVKAYMEWMLQLGKDGYSGEYMLPLGAEVQGTTNIHEVDVYHESSIMFLSFFLLTLSPISGNQNVVVHHLSTDEYVCGALIQQGLMPCAPYSPSTAISIQALKLFHSTQLHCPHVTVHSFMKTLCNMHAEPFKLYLSHQFSITFDLYLSIVNNVDQLVQVYLDCDAADYHIKHLCPSCTYILKGEKKLKFSMLYTVDGNDSLKRILQREDAPEWQEAQEPAMAEPTPATAAEPTAAKAPTITEGPLLGPSSEVKDSQTAGCSIYLTREQVDEWAKEVLMEDMPGFDYDNDNPCAEHWWNMKNELTSKMWRGF